MKYCKILERNCSLVDVCNKKLFDFSNISPLDSYLVELYLWLRDVIKLENIKYKDLKILKQDIERIWIIKKYELSYIELNNQKFCVISKSRSDTIDFLKADFISNQYKRSIATWLKLWYPKCCIKEYSDIVLKKWDLFHTDEIVKKSIKLKDSVKNSNKCPILSNVNFLTYYKCNPLCEESLKIAETKLKYLYEKNYIDSKSIICE